MTGLESLPFRAAWAVATALRVYRAIGTEVVRRGPAAWDHRVSTSGAAKLGHVAAGALIGLRAILPSGGSGAAAMVRTDARARNKSA